MPNINTHMLVGLDVANTDKSLTKTKIEIPTTDISKMANGQDFTNSNKKLIDITHESKIDCFFIETIKYIKENNLRENANALAYLYGHIIHFVTDRVFHPYIYYFEHGSKKNLLVPTHFILEAVLDGIVLSLYGQKPSINKSLLNNKIYDEKTNELINNIYSNVYNYDNAVKLYKEGSRRLYLLSYATSTSYKLFKQMLPPVITSSYLKNNGLKDFSFLANDDHKTWRHFITGDVCNKSVKDLLELSKYLSLELINIANRYIYDYRPSLESVYNAFPNTSYSTGLKNIEYTPNACKYAVNFKQYIK